MTAPTVFLDIDLSPQPGAGFAYLAPLQTVTDPADSLTLTTAPQVIAFNGTEQSPQLYATDNQNMSPSGWSYSLAFSQSPFIPGPPAPLTSFQVPVGPLPYTATHATPCAVTPAYTSAFTSIFPGGLPNGTGVEFLTGTPGGFTVSTTYYVVNAGATTFQLAATRGGSAIASTGTGSGTLQITRYTYSGLVPQAPLLAVTPFLTAAGNLAGIASQAAAQANLGLGAAALKTTAYFQHTLNAVFLTAGAVYNASADDFAIANCSTGSTTVNLPNAPANGSLVAVKMNQQSGSYSTAISTQGSDVFEVTGGATSETITSLFATLLWQYNAAEGVWLQTGGGGAGASSGVASFNSRTGAIVPASGDYTVSEITGAAPTASPTFTGTPVAPTKTPLTDSTAIATTAYADAAVAVELSRAETAEALKANLASPTFTGNPTAPTQTAGDSSTKLATTAFVQGAIPAYGISASPSSGSSVTVNLANGLTQSVTLTSNCTLTFSNWPAGSDTASAVTVIVIENATGGYTPTFPGTVTWIGNPPAQNTAANGISVYSFLSPDGGTSVYGAGVSNVFTGPASGDIFDWYTNAGALVASLDSTGRAHFTGADIGSNTYAGSGCYGTTSGEHVWDTADVASAVNHVVFENSTTGNGPTIVPATDGTDTNIDMNLAGLGTGAVGLTNATTTTSAPSAGGAGALPATPTGYVTIKVNGTARKVAYY